MPFVVAAGLVASLARLGGMVTGLTMPPALLFQADEVIR
jgi:hypothetical protein